ncbi:MAG: cation:proton antiporter [Thermoplasmata archaeon]
MPLQSEFLRVSLILILAAFSIPIARKFSIAEVPVLIILGLLFGPLTGIINHTYASYLMVSYASVGLGMIGIVIILYSESHKIDFKILRREFVRIASLDSLGIVITMVVIAFFFSFITHAPLIIGFLFGAILAPTDPVTIIPIFRKLRVKEDIYGIVLGESLFNDPVSIIFFTLIIALIVPGSTYSPLFNGVTSLFGLITGSAVFLIIQIAVPALIGIAVGFSILYLNKIFNFENFILGLLLGVVLLEFAVFSAVSITPFPAIIATGAIVGNFSDKSLFWQREANFQDNLSFLAQSIIFILLGAILTLQDIERYLVVGVLTALALIFLARPAAVMSSLTIADRGKSRLRLDNVKKLFISFVGPRGTVTVVLSTIPYVIGTSLNNALLIEWGPIIYSIASIIVLVSIVFLALFIPLLSKNFFPEEKNNSTQD